ncbi:MAG: dicarboxylate/amino acid:cation symporter [Sphingobacteriia bacterium]|nr:dicarboxylate/amino acid:cation symporter [Sphingobacteriia bacterium]
MKLGKIFNFFKRPLWQQVIVAAVLGIITGILFDDKCENLKYLGMVFINLIKMVIIPLIVFSLISAITSLESSEKASYIGVKSILSFLATSLIAVLIGLISTLVLEPGKNVVIPYVSSTKAVNHDIKILDFLVGFIPENAISSMAQGNIIQVIVFSVLVGIAIVSIKNKCPTLINLANEGSLVIFRMIENIVKLAPIGVFGYMAWSIGTQGVEVLISLVKLVGIIIFCCILQYILYGLYIIIFAKMNPIPFFVKMLEPQVLAFSTSSSKATLTTTMRVMHEEIGVSRNATNFVLPIGTSINMNGGAIYLSATCIFFAQAFGIELDMSKLMVLAFTCTIGSIGAAGIPSGILLFLGMSLEAVGLPTELVVLVAGVDRILDMFTTMINVTGDACITMIVDKTENTMDLKKYYSKISFASQPSE